MVTEDRREWHRVTNMNKQYTKRNVQQPVTTNGNNNNGIKDSKLN